MAADSAEPAVAVSKVTQDHRIQKRLTSILEASAWFSELSVSVDSGIVILEGVGDNLEHIKWAEEMTGRTEGVIAVVNKVQPRALGFFDLSPAKEEVAKLIRSISRNLPFIVLALLVLGLTFFVTSSSAKLIRKVLRLRIGSDLLLMTISRALVVPIFLIGIYTVLQIGGLTRVAMTLVGGTGILGLVLGLAFRGILENYLASLILSVRQPYRVGDVVELLGHQGVIDSVTTRATVLIDYDGNHVLIPNSLVFNSIVKNQTANPNMRVNFEVGIAQDESVAEAQGLILEVLRRHASVSKEIDSMVIVEGLGSSTVNLGVYFWVNIKKHSWRKIRSVLITESKDALQTAGISLPDDAREMIFPAGIQVSMMSEKEASRVVLEAAPIKKVETSEQPSQSLESEQGDLKKIARESFLPNQGANIVGEEELGGTR